MKRSRLRLLGLALVIGLLACGWGAYLSRPVNAHDRLITAEAFARIQPGMTLPEVQAVLGLPPADYRPPGSDAWTLRNYTEVQNSGSVPPKAYYASRPWDIAGIEQSSFY